MCDLLFAMILCRNKYITYNICKKIDKKIDKKIENVYFC